MLLRRVITFAVVCGFGVSSVPDSAAQQIWDRLPGTPVLIEDRSEIGSPLVFSGSATIWEEPVRDGLRQVFQDNFEATNLSGKTILAFVVQWRHIGSWGQESSRNQRVEDCFFADDVIPSGGIISFKFDRRDDTTMTPFDTSRPRQKPRAFVHVRYVQFTDGSEFGSRIHAEELYRVRNGIWRQLRRLDRAYRKGGPEAFVEELNDPVEHYAVNYFFNGTRKILDSQGVVAAYAHVQRALALAKEHRKALGNEE